MTDDEWLILRNIVFDAADGFNRKQPPADAPAHPAVELVRQFFSTSDLALLDKAAKMVALQKPGMPDHSVNDRNYWLVIDKS